MFTQAGPMSAVTRQPQSPEERLAAGRALLSCPTASIGLEGEKSVINLAAQTLPLPIAENVYYTSGGFAAESSFGAASYFIKREGGNVLIDSPRMNGNLGRHLEALGGVRWLYLTHRDDVADHQEWAGPLRLPAHHCTRPDMGLGHHEGHRDPDRGPGALQAGRATC